ncbi:hypothetical protein BZA70DRAFT_275029 [Myxozyma melibiosi]|uniref:Uncharacterized protein n=1 Tax=Myxozyma melibiosi TaxID=54550 RepID=A0ABR1FA90_9ASCO
MGLPLWRSPSPQPYEPVLSRDPFKCRRRELGSRIERPRQRSILPAGSVRRFIETHGISSSSSSSSFTSSSADHIHSTWRTRDSQPESAAAAVAAAAEVDPDPFEFLSAASSPSSPRHAEPETEGSRLASSINRRSMLSFLHFPDEDGDEDDEDEADNDDVNMDDDALSSRRRSRYDINSALERLEPRSRRDVDDDSASSSLVPSAWYRYYVPRLLDDGPLTNDDRGETDHGHTMPDDDAHDFPSTPSSSSQPSSSESFLTLFNNRYSSTSSTSSRHASVLASTRDSALQRRRRRRIPLPPFHPHRSQSPPQLPSSSLTSTLSSSLATSDSSAPGPSSSSSHLSLPSAQHTDGLRRQYLRRQRSRFLRVHQNSMLNLSNGDNAATSTSAAAAEENEHERGLRLLMAARRQEVRERLHSQQQPSSSSQPTEQQPEEHEHESELWRLLEVRSERQLRDQNTHLELQARRLLLRSLQVDPTNPDRRDESEGSETERERERQQRSAVDLADTYSGTLLPNSSSASRHRHRLFRLGAASRSGSLAAPQVPRSEEHPLIFPRPASTDPSGSNEPPLRRMRGSPPLFNESTSSAPASSSSSSTLRRIIQGSMHRRSLTDGLGDRDRSPVFDHDDNDGTSQNLSTAASSAALDNARDSSSSSSSAVTASAVASTVADESSSVACEVGDDFLSIEALAETR